jgi:hypothetical protein
VTLYTGGSDGFVASTAAPIATEWNEPVLGRDSHPQWTSAFHGLDELGLGAGVRLHPIDKTWLRLPDSRGDWHVCEAVSQAYTLVLILHSIGELHTKLMTLSVQYFWFEPQLITKMQLPQNFRQGA